MNLENRFFYRLVKVVYYFFLAISTLVILFINYNELVYFPIDNNRSYIACYYGKHYSLVSSDITLYSYWNNYQLSYDDDEKAKKSCSKNIPESVSSNSKPYTPTLADIEEIENAEKYSLVIARDWAKIGNVVFYSMFYFVIIFSILNVIREALLYLAFGKKLTWDWLIKIYNYVKKIL